MKTKEFFSVGQYAQFEYNGKNVADSLQKIVNFKQGYSVADGYALTVTDSQISVLYNGRGKAYALKALEQNCTICGNKLTVLQCYQEDFPHMKMRGIIEGFYGKPYSEKQRLQLIKFCEDNRLNCYFYAPKDDAYHRELWREDYPDQQLASLVGLVQAAKASDIDFYYCISPGKDFDYCNDNDYLTLINKLKKLQEKGIENFSLLLDDIDYTLNEQTKNRFETPAQAHAYLSNFLNKNLRLKQPLIICPTEYMQDYDTPYRKGLREHLDFNISVFWTGYNTVAEVITGQQAQRVSSAFGGRKLVLWDNFPCNDFEPKRRMYLSALSNRAASLKNYHEGMVANPMEAFNASKFSLYTMAQYMWDTTAYNPEVAQAEACKKYAPNCAEQMMFFINLNSDSVLSKADTLLDNAGTVAEAFSKKDFVKLDLFYKKVQQTVITLNANLDADIATELKVLFDYANAECEAYQAYRSGTITDKHIQPLITLKYRLADQSFLSFIKQQLNNDDIKIEPRRKVWWKNLPN